MRFFGAMMSEPCRTATSSAWQDCLAATAWSLVWGGVRSLVEQWYPFPFFGVQSSVTKQPTPKKGALIVYMFTGLPRIWTRRHGLYNVAEMPGFACQRYGWPAHALQLQDGACRGDHQTDSSPSYYEVHEATRGIEDCRARCAAALVCFGVEFAPAGGRCEVWRRPIRATAAVPGHECWTWP